MERFGRRLLVALIPRCCQRDSILSPLGPNRFDVTTIGELSSLGRVELANRVRAAGQSLDKTQCLDYLRPINLNVAPLDCCFHRPILISKRVLAHNVIRYRSTPAISDPV